MPENDVFMNELSKIGMVHFRDAMLSVFEEEDYSDGIREAQEIVELCCGRLVLGIW
jgi:hypothetical protein